MAASQQNPIDYNPNGLSLTCVATYKRRINASLERVWENVHDWAHLPWLHDSAFGPIQLQEQGSWGWRTVTSPAGSDNKMLVELCVDDVKSQYVARTYQADKQISEIWTRLSDQGDNTDIEVEFHVPDVPAESKDKLGEIYLKLYGRLWDEDEEMMVRRQLRLEQPMGPDHVELGTERELRAALPKTVRLKRGEFRIVEVEGELVVHSSICPHLLGPLEQAEIKDSCVTCPWHGYQFEVTTGQCLTAGQQHLQLPKPPKIWKSDSGNMTLAYQAP